MLNNFIKRYLTLLFILSTLLGVFHHHDDLKIHTDCQICTIQSSIADADTPSDVLYFTSINTLFGKVLKTLKVSSSKTLYNPLKARAPPSIS